MLHSRRWAGRGEGLAYWASKVVAWSALLSPLWLCHSRMMGDTGRKFRYASRDRAATVATEWFAGPALAMRLMALFPTVYVIISRSQVRPE